MDISEAALDNALEETAWVREKERETGEGYTVYERERERLVRNRMRNVLNSKAERRNERV